jgi:hypothetical protein
MDYNKGYAQVLDQSGTDRAIQYIQQQTERRRLLNEQQQQQELKRKGLLSAYVGQQFDDKDFASGTAYDPIIRDKLAGIRGKYFSMIKNNDGLTDADIGMLMQKDLVDMGNLSGKLKMVKQNIDATAEKYKGVRGIDNNALRMTALNDALFKVDDKGNKVLKSQDEINPDIDYGTYAMDHHYDKIFNLGEDDVVSEFTKGLPLQKFGDNYDVTGAKGDRIKKKYTAETYPMFQDITQNPKSGEVGVVTKADQIKLPNGTVDVAPENLYNGFMNDPVKRMFLNKKLDETIPGIDKLSPEADLYRRRILYETLDKSLPKNIQKDFVEKAAPAPHIHVSVNTGDNTPYRDLYSEITNVTPTDKPANINILPQDAQVKIMDFVNKAIPKDLTGSGVGQDKISVKNTGGGVEVYVAGRDKPLVTLTDKDVNLGAAANQSTKQKKTILQRLGLKPSPPEIKTKVTDPELIKKLNGN